MPDNPFDTGLPMVPTPRRTPPQRRIRRPQPQPATDPSCPEGNREGSWNQWLDGQPPSAPQYRPSVVIQRNSLWSKDTDDGPATPRIVDRTGSNPGQGLRRRPKRQRDSRLAGRLAGMAIIVAVTAVVVVVILTTIHAGHRHTRMSTPPASSTPAAPGVDPHATEGCRQSAAGLSVSGTGSGDTRTGPGVVLAFNRAYYVARSGIDAAAFLAPDAEGVDRDGSRYPLTTDFVQAGINKTPADTRYCVSIEPDSADRWQVEITEQVGYEITAITHELVTTTTQDGRTLICMIVQP